MSMMEWIAEETPRRRDVESQILSVSDIEIIDST
jgi:hypothetical protein